MKKSVFIVEETGGEYDCIIKICSTRQKADSCAKKFNNDNDYNSEEDDCYARVVEYELDKDWC